MTAWPLQDGLQCSGEAMWFCGIQKAREALAALQLENEELRKELERYGA